jgi:major inositol transporter-like SP family MFS transporter
MPAQQPAPITPAAAPGTTASDFADLARRRTPRQRRFVVAVSAVAAIGGLLFGYDTGVISGALVYMNIGSGAPTVNGANLTVLEQGWVTSALLLAAAFGALFGGRIADRFGRRRVLLYAGVVFTAGAIVCAAAADIPILIIGRVLLGLAVGAASIISPLYIAELAPPDLRGRLVTVNSLMIVIGQLLAYTVNASIAFTMDWRLMLLVAGIPSLVLVAGMVFIPDTPRWYVASGRRAQAEAVLARVYDRPDAVAEIAAIESAVVAARREKVGVADLMTPWVRRILLIGIGIAALQQVTGVNSVMYFAPVLLSLTGLTGAVALTATIAVGVTCVVATLVGLLIVDRVGRRILLISGQVATVVCLVLLGVVIGHTGITIVHGQPVAATAGDPLWSWLTLATMLLFVAAQNLTVSPVVWLLLSEVFPQRVRGIAMGIAGFVLWIVNFAVGLLFLPVLGSFGGPFTFFCFAALGAVGLVFSTHFVPETRGKTLPQIEAETRAAIA